MTAKSRGWRRMHELRAEDEAAKRAIIDGLTSDLGREPTTSDRLAIEQIAALTIQARRLERRGQFAQATKVRDQITRSQRTNGIKPQPIEPPKPVEDFSARMRRLATPGAV
jgi:hypothetical protein